MLFGINFLDMNCESNFLRFS